MEVIKANNKNIDKIITALRSGEVLVLPTDTVYGLVCDATNKNAVEKIYKIKQRPESNPLPIFVRNLEMAQKLSLITEGQEEEIKDKWPGKYTFVLDRKKEVKLYGVDENTIALRIPKFKFLNDILNTAGTPLAQTSVNISGQPLLSKINEIVKFFDGKDERPELIVDAGDLPKNKPSTIIDLTDNKIKILRK